VVCLAHSVGFLSAYAIVDVDYSDADAARLEKFEIASEGGSECRLPSAEDPRVEEQVAFVDEVRFEREPRKLRAADEDVDTYLCQAPSGQVPLGRMIVVPAAIDFEDGSSWAARTSPPIGSRTPFP